MAKKFFYVCAGIFLLALSWHFGARSAGAQVGSSIAGFGAVNGAASGGYADANLFVLTPNGEVYARYMNSLNGNLELVHMGNFWSGGGPTPSKPETWGSIKARYR